MSNVTETPLSHEQAAKQMLETLRQLVQTIRGYGFTSVRQRRRLIPAASLPTPYLLAVGVALDASEQLARASDLTGAEVRDIVTFINAYGPVADEMALVATGLRQTVQSARGELGKKCLKVYSMAKSFNRPTDRDVLIPHIADMKRTLGRGRRKATDPASEPQQAGAPAAPGGSNAA